MCGTRPHARRVAPHAAAVAGPEEQGGGKEPFWRSCAMKAVEVWKAERPRYMRWPRLEYYYALKPSVLLRRRLTSSRNSGRYFLFTGWNTDKKAYVLPEKEWRRWTNAAPYQPVFEAVVLHGARLKLTPCVIRKVLADVLQFHPDEYGCVWSGQHYKEGFEQLFANLSDIIVLWIGWCALEGIGLEIFYPTVWHRLKEIIIFRRSQTLGMHALRTSIWKSLQAGLKPRPKSYKKEEGSLIIQGHLTGEYYIAEKKPSPRFLRRWQKPGGFHHELRLFNHAIWIKDGFPCIFPVDNQVVILSPQLFDGNFSSTEPTYKFPQWVEVEIFSPDHPPCDLVVEDNEVLILWHPFPDSGVAD